jgi:hypothetical protein
MVADFKKMNDDTLGEGNKKVAELEQIEERINVNLRSSTVGSPQYDQWTNLKRFIGLDIRVQLHQMLNASNEYILALSTAIAVQAILEKQSPTLAEELVGAKKELDDHFAKRTAQLAKLFSVEGHEAMYGAGSRSKDSTD